MALTWLHVSDFHFKAGDPYDRDVVLRALVAAVRQFREEEGRRPDLIFATGDIGYSGKKVEYVLAEKFFDDLLDAAGLTGQRERLFVVPGNHDVDRDLGKGLQRTLSSGKDANDYFGPASPRYHFNKLTAYRDWYDRYFAGIRTCPSDSTCTPLQVVEISGERLAILALNSALFAQGDDDHGKLWLGRRCLDAVLDAVLPAGMPNASLRIALLHHPLDWLHEDEQSRIDARLQRWADVVLRGHLHKTMLKRIATTAGDTLHLAAGAAYQTREFPNKALYCTVQGDSVEVFPIRYEDDSDEVWVLDPSVFPHKPGYTGVFPLSRRGSKGQRKERIKGELQACGRGDVTIDPLPPDPTRLQCRLEALLREVIADPSLHRHPFLLAWQHRNPDVLLAGIARYCCTGADSPAGLLWAISEAVREAHGGGQGGFSLAAGTDKVADLVACMCLVASERWVRAEPVAGRAPQENVLPSVRMFEEVAAAVVAATWLNLGLKLRFQDSAGGSRIEVENLIRDRAEIQFGAKTLEDTIDDEIGSRLLDTLAVPGERAQRPHHPADIKAGIDRLEKRMGVRLIVGIRADDGQGQVHEALRERLKKRYGVDMFLYGGAAGSPPDAEQQAWLDLQDALMGHFARILRPLYQPPATQPSQAPPA